MAVRVCIVDDHPALLKGLARILKPSSEFLIVGRALGGRDAVALAARKRPDVMVLDLQLPDMDAMDMIHAIKEVSDNTKIVIYSGVDDPHLIRRVVRSGIAGYIHKAESMVSIRRAVAAVATGERYVSPKIEDLLKRAEKSAIALTQKEEEVVRLVAQGCTARQIAEMLHISEKAVEGRRRQIAQKLGLTSIAEITRLAVELGLV